MIIWHFEIKSHLTPFREEVGHIQDEYFRSLFSFLLVCHHIKFWSISLGKGPKNMRRLPIEWLYFEEIIVSIITEYKMKRQFSSVYCCQEASMPAYDVNEKVFTDRASQCKLLRWTLSLKIWDANCGIFISLITEPLRWKWHEIQLLAKMKVYKNLQVMIFIKVIFFTMMLKCERMTW